MSESNSLKLKQSNALIIATHEMNINQMRTFLYVCSQYKGDLKLDLSFRDMNNVLNPNRGTNQKELLINTIRTMMRNAFVNLDIDKDDDYYDAPVFIVARKKRNEDIMHFEFNPHVAKELEELRGYTWMYLSQLTGMSSMYAVRLYEFFAMRLGANNKSGKFDFNIQQLRLYLDCTKKFSDFRNFEKRVLQIAKEQINEKTNITMDYKKVKTSRSITNIVFTFKWKNKDDAITVAEPKQRETTYSDDEYAALDERIKKLNE